MNKLRWVLSYLVAPLITLVVLMPLRPSEVYAAPGELDPTFGDGGKVITDFTTRAGSESYALAVQSDGKLVLAGYADDTYEDLSFGLIRLNADGSPDMTFGIDGRVGTSFGPGEDRVEAVAIQSDGKIVAAGYTFADAGSGSQNFALARYNVDGALDPTFGTGGMVTTDFGTSRDKGYAIAIGSNGKIVVAGLTTVDNDDFALARYNPDGSLDGSFGTGGKVRTAFSFGSMDEAYGVAILPDGKIVAAGKSGFFFGLARYNLNGSLDGNFGTGGMVTTTFAEGDAEATALVIQADGKIVASGHTRSNSDYSVVLARYTTNGDLDTSFDSDGRVVTNFSNTTEVAYALAIQSGGKLVVAGRAGSSGSDFALARYNPDGSPDGNFGGGGQVTTSLSDGFDTVHGLAVQGDVKIVAAGVAGSQPEIRSGVARYNSDGSLDSSFGTEGKVVISALRSGASETFAVAIQPDGKILAGGSNGYSYNDSFALARYNPDGSLDQSFGDSGKTSTFFEFGAVLYALIVQPDGKIVAAGYDYTAADSHNFALVRYNPDGSLDTTFGNGGIVSTDMGAMDKAYAIAIYSDGKLVVAGASRGRFALARYDSSGTLDPTFGAGGILTTDFANDDDRATSIVIQPDGKVVAAGYATTRTCAVDCTLYSDFALARYNLNGSLDATFGTAGKVTTDFGREDHVNGLVRQADGKLVAGGQTRHSIGGTGHDFGLARYNPDGSLDTTFGAGGKVITDFAGSHDGAYGLTLASKGKMVAVGYMTTGPSLYSTNFALTRYNYDGTLDSSFGSGGKVVTDFGSNTDNANATAMQANGKIIAAGYTLASGDSDFALARYRVTDETEPTNTPAPATPTSTAASASSTSIAATPISTSTAMPTCEVAFTDVQEGSTFYPFVRCLACHSILGGYSDNTFRPNNEVTRGQLSKIVANSANFNEPATGQTFEDVSPSDTFYQFIERMASRGIIGGYPCGGVSEPCGSGKPYFRPNANATRGQISKIVSEAAGIADPPGSQKFADVAPGSTFYDWVNRLANKGVMGGYNCGGAGEPCGPGNLPYFRPGNNATRGQTSKIVSGAFFPTCGAESKP